MNKPAGRAERGLGPFKRGHLTAIVVTLAVLVAFPLAASAVTGNNVFITDPITGSHVRVGPHHSLEESVHDASNGKAAQVGAEGRLATNAAGTVSAAVTLPTKDIATTKLDGVFLPLVEDNCPAGICATLIAAPPDQALVVTSVHVDVFQADATASNSEIQLLLGGDNTCALATTLAFLDDVHAAEVGVTELDYPPPASLTLRAGQAICARSLDAGNISAEVSAFGYAVSPSEVP